MNLQHTFFLRCAVAWASTALGACAAAVTPGPEAGADAGREAGADAGSECQSVAPVELRVPRVARDRAAHPVSTRADGRGCECAARMQVSGLSVAMQICNCCRECDCVDPAYVADGALDLRAAPETVDVVAGEHRQRVDIVPADQACVATGARIDRVRVVADDDARSGRRRRVWAEVAGTALRCSGEVLPWIEVRSGSPITLVPHDCNNTDCDGPTRPEPYATWVLLGELAPGRYMLFYSPGVSQGFEVR